MKVFFDTEFTGLHKETTLISIGLVDENGRTFYAEFSDYDDGQCDKWIYENVIKNLKWSKEGPLENFVNLYKNEEGQDKWEAYGTKDYIRTVLIDWFAKYEEVELISDVCHYDMVLFIDIFGSAWTIPSVVNPACHDINQDIAKHFDISEKEAFDMSREGIIESYNKKLMALWPKEVIKIKGDKHNSLYDAKVIRGIYKIINK